jgi:hypothetical protein
LPCSQFNANTRQNVQKKRPRGAGRTCMTSMIAVDFATGSSFDSSLGHCWRNWVQFFWLDSLKYPHLPRSLDMQGLNSIVRTGPEARGAHLCSMIGDIGMHTLQVARSTRAWAIRRRLRFDSSSSSSLLFCSAQSIGSYELSRWKVRLNQSKREK